MSNLDNIKSSFSRRLDERKIHHEADLQAEIQELRSHLLGMVPPTLRAEAAQTLREVDNSLNPTQTRLAENKRNMIKFPTLVNIGQLDQLRQIDQVFWEHFRLGDYYPAERLQYMTQYCETLSEFFQPLVEIHRSISASAGSPAGSDDQ